MGLKEKTSIPQILKKDNSSLLTEWVQEQKSSLRQLMVKEAELHQQCTQFLALFRQAMEGDALDNIETKQWEQVREMLASLSRSRGQLGFTPSETAMFVFFPEKTTLQPTPRITGNDLELLTKDTLLLGNILDQLGLFTMEIFQQSREEVIGRQQQEMLELSTPVVKLWDGILAVPLIGTLDSARTQVVMESLLQTIVSTGAEIAIIDITGVPTVDTLVAQHLIKTVTAARLMGAECIISGIRPQIAQTIVHLGVDLGNVSTKASLAEALKLALQRSGLTVTRTRAVLRKDLLMERIPILQMGEFLLVTIQVDMHDRLAMTLQDDLTNRVCATSARGVLIDISSLEIVDSFIGRMIANISSMVRILDAETVVVGMQPAVAITLVELGMSLSGVRTALNVEKGMRLLQASIRLQQGEDHDARFET